MKIQKNVICVLFLSIYVNRIKAPVSNPNLVYTGHYPCPGGSFFNPAATSSNYHAWAGNCGSYTWTLTFVCPFKQFAAYFSAGFFRGRDGCNTFDPLGCEYMQNLHVRCVDDNHWQTFFNYFGYNMQYDVGSYLGQNFEQPFRHLVYGEYNMFGVSGSIDPPYVNPAYLSPIGTVNSCPTGIVGYGYHQIKIAYNAKPYDANQRENHFSRICPICDTTCIPCTVGNYCPASSTSVSVSPIPCPRGFFCVAGVETPSPCFKGTYASLLGQSECLPCAPGTFMPSFNASSCLSCAPGTFSNLQGAFACPACAASKFSSQSGASECPWCPAGSFGTATRSSFCSACAVGTFAAFTGRSECAECPAGTFASAEGTSNCISCLAGGTFSNQTRQTSCHICNRGFTTTAAGLTTCSACVAPPFNSQYVHLCNWVCNAGFFNLSNTECVPCLNRAQCPVGSFRPSCGSNCTGVCTAGNERVQNVIWLSPSAFNNASGCQWGCPSGRYKDAITQTCRCCAVDFMQRNQTIIDSQCTGYTSRCEIGRFPQGECYSIWGVQTFGTVPICANCTPIGNGTFTSQGVINSLTSCQFTCNHGFFANNGRCQQWTAICASGFAWNPGTAILDATCSPCEFRNDPNYVFLSNVCNFTCGIRYELNHNRTRCQGCTAGKFKNNNLAVPCALCPINTYQSNPIQSECINVPANGVANADRVNFTCNAGYVWRFPPLQLAPICSVCNLGEFAASNNLCPGCPPGTFNSLGTAITACTACVAGKYASGNGTINCIDCFPGFFSAGLNPKPQCDPCAVGTFSAGNGASSCLGCAHGTYAPSHGRTQCIAWDSTCNAGFAWAAGNARENATCTKCQYTPSSILIFVQNTCTYSCANGYQVVGGVSGCEACSAGRFKDNTITFCTQCVPGTFQIATAMSVCSECLAGTYATVSGAIVSSVCIRCKRGMFTSVPRSTICLACSIGTYSTTFGSSSCLQCANGHTNGRGSTYCYPVGSNTAFYNMQASPACQGISDLGFTVCTM